MNTSSPSRRIIWIVWFLASLFYAYQYVLRVMPNIMLADIMHQFQIDAAAFGQFSGVYYIGYSLLHLPVGIFLDRFGPRKTLSLCILLTVVGLLPLLFATHWVYPLLGRLLVGLGSSAAILGVFKIIRMTFKEQQFSRMLSLSVMIGLLGAIYGGGPVNHLCQAYGYKAVITLFACLGTVLAALTYWIVPSSESTSQGNVLSDVKEVLKNQKVLWTCFFAGLMVGPLEGFADVWGTVFLKQICGIEGTVAASLPSLIFIGMCFGSPILSFIAEKTGDYLLTIFGAALAMIASFLLLLCVSLQASWISANFILIGVCCAYQVLAIYKACTYTREQVAGITTAVANMIIMIFGYAFHSIIGSLIQTLGGPTSKLALIYGISVIPAALCLGAIGFLVLSLQERKRIQSLSSNL